MTGWLAALTWLALEVVEAAACAASPASPDPAASQKGRRMSDPGALFDEAVLATGQAYLDTEAALRAVGDQLAPVLAARQRVADPIAQLLADVLTQAAAGKAAAQLGAIKYLDEIGEKMRPTALGKPSPIGVAKYLAKHFADGVVELLALRLSKETDWPYWREAGVLLYLDLHAASHPLITVPLVRFAVRSSHGDLREQVVTSLEKQEDAVLLDRLRQERESAHTVGQPWPSALLILENKRRRAGEK